jgi:hypothetical protein
MNINWLNPIAWLAPRKASSGVSESSNKSNDTWQSSNNVEPATQTIRVNKSAANNTVGIGGLAPVLVLMLMIYGLAMLFIWVAEEPVFYHYYHVDLDDFHWLIDYLPRGISDFNPDMRYVMAKISTLVFSYPLLIMVVYLVYQILLTTLYVAGCSVNRNVYAMPISKIQRVQLITQIAPACGILSSMWALMNKGDSLSQQTIYIMAGPSFLGVLCFIFALVYLNWVNESKRIKVVTNG